jgi:hypothetical protein
MNVYSVLFQCALDKDLKLFDAGDQTEGKQLRSPVSIREELTRLDVVGEKGLTLRQVSNLDRSCNADLYS